jgi:hypothetical protein
VEAVSSVELRSPRHINYCHNFYYFSTPHEPKSEQMVLRYLHRLALAVTIRDLHE